MVLLGDTHSVDNTIRAIREISTVAENVQIVHLGDTGFTFDPRKIAGQLRYLDQMLAARHHKAYFMRGNHDRRQPFADAMSSNHIQLLPDYSWLECRDRRILTVGGGVSIDRVHRLKENWVYDPHEMTDPMPENLDHADIVLAHDVPRDFFEAYRHEFAPYHKLIEEDPELNRDTTANRQLMQNILEATQPGAWYAGHYHNPFSATKDQVYYRILAPNELYTPYIR